MIQSPSLNSSGTPSYEVKFLVDRGTATRIAGWASGEMARDPYGDDSGSYHTRTLYLDTEQLDVFRQQPGYKVSKYRVRQYGESDCVSLERKTKRGDRVKKLRSVVSLRELGRLSTPLVLSDEEAAWFHSEVSGKKLHPRALVEYSRRAFVGEGRRLTLDQEVRSRLHYSWSLTGSGQHAELLPGKVILELKFSEAMPALFRALLIREDLTPNKVSKYRTSIDGLNAEELRCRTS